MSKNRYRLDIAYDGAQFYGIAPQPGLRTVCGLLDEALALVLGQPADLVVAGRTDAGVHALGQVLHIDTLAEPESAWLLARLRSVLRREQDLQLRALHRVSTDFHARFSALGRRYVYRIADQGSWIDPRLRGGFYQLSDRLDDRLMRRAAAQLLGLKDFGAFCKPREGATTIRHLREFEVTRSPEGHLAFYLEADAFCHSMVRSLVGALVEVGRGRLSLQELIELTARAQRSSRIPLLPPAGLTLLEVSYPPDSLLAAQAQRTRDKRRLEG